jgi:2-keto-3-deoxy-L-arabinonate dehydratase
LNTQLVIPVLVTPFREDESIDEESLRNEVDFAIEKGATALCVPAFGSEYYKLSDQERLHVTEVVVRQCRHRVPVWASTGFPSIRSSIEFSVHAESLGADGVMVVAPRAVPMGTAELAVFFEAVCRSVRIPVMLQDADFQGGGLPVRFFVELAQRCPNLQYAKLENVLPGERCREIVRQSNGKVKVLYGWGGLRLFDGLAHGASGIMPGPALIDVYTQVVRLYDRGSVDEAKALFHRIVPFLVSALDHIELFIQMEKRVLTRRGVIPHFRMREPTLHLDELYSQQIEELVNLVVTIADDLHVSNG